MKSFRDKLGELPADRKTFIEAKGEELYEEFLSLQELRQALDLTQQSVAATMNIEQNNVSRLERRKDMKLSTLKAFVEALGCELSLVINIPGKGRVTISHFFDTTQTTLTSLDS
jgi:transcriptional regulator with XRE-family HTH domain